MASCELTHIARVPIDLEQARAEHRAYEARLEEAGCRVERLSSDAAMPDSVFVEDIAVVFDELAVITRPGAVSRRVETPAVADALLPHRALRVIEAPGTLDGGDVLVTGRRVFVGRSQRTNDAGIQQLKNILEPHRYKVEAVTVDQCLHLKSAVTEIARDVLLVNPAWLPAQAFKGFDRIEVHPDEPWAANALLIGGAVIYPDRWVLTRDRLERKGVEVWPVAVGELAKAEGAVTCCSLILRTAP